MFIIVVEEPTTSLMLWPLSTLAKPKEILRYNFICLIITGRQIYQIEEEDQHSSIIQFFYFGRYINDEKLPVVNELFRINLLV